MVIVVVEGEGGRRIVVHVMVQSLMSKNPKTQEYSTYYEDEEEEEEEKAIILLFLLLIFFISLFPFLLVLGLF